MLIPVLFGSFFLLLTYLVRQVIALGLVAGSFTTIDRDNYF